MTVSAITSRTNGNSQGQNTSQQEAMMPQHHEQRRKHALDRYLAGDKIDHICQQMACSKSWLYKWKARYQPGDPSWATERSRRPTSHAHKTPSIIEQVVIEMQRTLDQNGPSCGAQAIRQALEPQGIASVPSLRTIYRILQRHQKEER
jgi:transposase